jgi:hypothetical protein
MGAGCDLGIAVKGNCRKCNAKFKSGEPVFAYWGGGYSSGRWCVGCLKALCDELEMKHNAFELLELKNEAEKTGIEVGQKE